MGMDVCGTHPTTERGEYFRASVWGWRPLAQYILQVAPLTLTSQCQSWQYNDGAGLDDEGSKQLAAILREEVASGRTADYVEGRNDWLNNLPLQQCELCDGIGIRTDQVGKDAGMDKKVIGADTYVHGIPKHPRFGQVGWCNGCDGTGKKKSFETYYPFDIEIVLEFAAFLETCGGFEIW